jgi:hypothetical protein
LRKDNSEEKFMSSKAWWGFVLIVLLPAIIAGGGFGLLEYSTPILAWLFILAGMLLFFLIAGQSVSGRFLGCLIDERNVMSLSRLQLIGWTVLILSVYFTVVLMRIRWNAGIAAVDIYVDGKLWALMGISTTSLVASPLILSTKTDKPADSAEKSTTFELLRRQGDDPDQLGNKGQIVTNNMPTQARWSDLLTGEEVANAAHLDLTRVQMLFFTLVALLAYAIAAGQFLLKLTEATSPVNLPALSEGIVAIIGISHAGYLTAKAVPRSTTLVADATTADAGDIATPTPAAG